MSRVSSRDRINKVKRRIQSALNSHEPGTLPAVQRAKPNQEDYDDLCSEASRSPSPARRGASTRNRIYNINRNVSCIKTFISFILANTEIKKSIMYILFLWCFSLHWVPYSGACFAPLIRDFGTEALF